LYCDFRDRSVEERLDRRGHNATNVFETFPAQHWPVLDREKRYGGLYPAFRAKKPGFTTIARNLGHSLCFAFLAMFWVVNEALLPKKHLFARRKDERLRAFDT